METGEFGFKDLIRKAKSRLEITQVCRKFDMPRESGENTICAANELIHRFGYKDVKPAHLAFEVLFDYQKEKGIGRFEKLTSEYREDWQEKEHFRLHEAVKSGEIDDDQSKRLIGMFPLPVRKMAAHQLSSMSLDDFEEEI